MKSYEIYWKDLNEEAKKRLKDLYHENIDISPLAVIDIEEETDENEPERVCEICGFEHCEEEEYNHEPIY
jgi:cytidylate kinase